MLIDTLKKDNMLALKNHDNVKRGILGVVMSKYTILATDQKVIESGGVKDQDLVKIIQKTIKETEDEKNEYLSAGRAETAKDLSYQIEVLKSYLPKMLSKDEIKSIIEKLEDKSVPAVMKYFKENYAGKVDNGLVLQVTREINA